MFRMVKDDTGGVLRYGVLRDGAGFKAVSGYGWNWNDYGDVDVCWKFSTMWEPRVFRVWGGGSGDRAVAS